MAGVVVQASDVVAFVATASDSQTALLIVAAAGWIALTLAMSGLLTRRMPGAGTPSGRSWTVSDRCGPGERSEEWGAPQHGPDDEVAHGRAGRSSRWLLADELHRVPVHVVEPLGAGERATTPADPTAGAMLEDLAGSVLDAGASEHRRAWGGVLLHGNDVHDTAALPLALAADHGVPLLVVRAHDIVPVDHRPVVEPVVTLAQSMAPCVLLVEGIDELADPAALLVISRHRRRIEHELATAVMTADRTSSVVVVATACAVDLVAPTLLQDGRFDRLIPVGAPTARQRRLIVQTELLHNDAALDGPLDQVIRLTAGMHRLEIVGAVHRACRLARRRAPMAVPLGVSVVDLRAALRDLSTDRPLAIGPAAETRIGTLVDHLRDPTANIGLVLAGRENNGVTEIARIIAGRAGRSVAWLDGDELRASPIEDIEQRVAAALDDLPVVVVWDRLDALIGSAATDDRLRKSVIVVIEALATAPGVAIVATMRRPDVLAPTLIDDGTLEVLWIPTPRFHDRVALLSHELSDAALVDTTVEELAAGLVGLTRAQLIARCHAALRAAALRGSHHVRAMELRRTDFG